MMRTLAAASLLALAAPPSAGAASGSPAAVSGVPARAATQQGRFDGQITVSRYAASGTDIVARGRLQGRLRDRRYPSAQPIDQAFSTVVTVAAGPAGAPCGNLTLRFAGKTVRLFGLRAALAPRTVAVRPRGQNAAGIREVLCAATDLLAAAPPPAPAPQPPPSWLLHLLNAVRAVDR